MSKKSKKQRAKARQAQVRRESGTVLRAVTPPSAGAKVLKLERPRADAGSVPDAGNPSTIPAARAKDEAPAEVTARNAIFPAKLSEEDASPESTGETDAPRETTRADEGAAPELLEEHRASRRVSVAVDIHLASESHFFSGLSGDISEGGLFVSTYRPLTIGTQVDVEFSLPGAEHPVHARGEVRWIREHSAEQPRGVGIAFEDLTEEDREEIHQFCSSRPPLYYDDVG